MKRLRAMLGGTKLVERVGPRRYARLELVDVLPPAEEEWVPGVVVRFRLTTYTVDLARGGRCYTDATRMRPRKIPSADRKDSSVLGVDLGSGPDHTGIMWVEPDGTVSTVEVPAGAPSTDLVRS